MQTAIVYETNQTGVFMKELKRNIKKVLIMIAPFGATNSQAEWLKNKSATTGDSQASILRGLIQGEINNENDK